jgi:hypothetical protein
MFIIACLHEEGFDLLPPLKPQSLLCIVIVVVVVVIIIIRGQILVFEFGSQTDVLGFRYKKVEVL